VPLDVPVFDPTSHPSCGNSFTADRVEALTTIYSSDMSVRHWQPEHLDVWLGANGNTEFAGSNFAPRSLIGQHFKESWENCLAARSELCVSGRKGLLHCANGATFGCEVALPLPATFR
jgi:uncharacterized NAD(P)/FAD-binding protein YdhS